MDKSLKKRKGPSESATKFSIGIKKKGNDGNMWKIVKNKNGTKRWSKISNLKSKTIKSKRLLKLEKDPESVWGKNKKLEKFWRKLSTGTHVVLIYKDKLYNVVSLPRSKVADQKKLEEYKNNPNIIAIITSAMSVDTYVSLYKKVKDKTPDFVIKNYKKILTNYGNDKTWYL